MSRGDMADFMAKHSCDLIFILRENDQARCDENVTTWNSKSIGFGCLDEVEFKIKRGWTHLGD